MNKDTARTLVEKTLHNEFDKERFCRFIRELLNHYEEKPFVYKGKYIREAYAPYIQSLERIGSYQDSDGKKIDILIAKLKKGSSLERARTMQRNFIAWYLTSRDPKDAALVAFVSPDPEDWRFSLVKMEYKIGETPTGRVKGVQEYTPARRLSFLVGTHETSHTAQSRLVPIIEDDEIDPTLSRIEDAFSIEKATKEFFIEYRGLFHQVNEALEIIIKKDASIRKDFKTKNIDTVDFAKKLLGQIVFLYFLQKKGWFGVKRKQEWGSGSKNFLRKLFEKKHGDYDNFFNEVLEPLFYEALRYDRTHDDDYFSMFKCRIPFLNGGLFDPINDYDWVETDILIPNELFSNSKLTKEKDKGTGILDIFDRYNFTVKEDEPLEKEVAVDPEMLGKVFENLLAVKDRKSKGTYYTPREIVHYMCQESLINYLATELEGNAEKEDIETLVKFGDTFIEHDSRVVREGRETRDYPFKAPESIRDNAKLIDDKLATIRVCDPAVGSGAFPVGMMNEIIRARTVLTTYPNIKNKLKRTPYHFKRHAIQECLYGVDIDSSAVEIAKLRLWLSLVVDEEDRKTIQPLPNLDYKIVCGNSLLGVEIDLLNYPLFDQLEKLKPLHFNESNPSKKDKYKKQIDELICKITNGHKDFDFKVYFSEVFHEKEGFDVVIANPPYLSHDKITDKKLIEKQFKSYEPFADLYCYFLEIALNIQSRKGILCYITSNSYLKADYGLYLRRLLTEKNYLLALINIEDFAMFDEAIVNTSVLVAQKRFPKATPACFIVNQSYDGQVSFDTFIKNSGFLFAQEDFNDKAWYLLRSPQLSLKRKIEQAGKSLKTLGTKIRLGIATGANDVFVIDNKLKNELIRKDQQNKRVIKPILRGRDIFRYKYQHNNQYIILTSNGINVKQEYPVLYKYFDSFGPSFKKRGAKGEHWSNLRATAFLADFKKENIVWIELTDQGRFALCSQEMYLLNSAYFLIPPEQFASKYLLALLNSNLMGFYLSIIAETSGMGVTRWINNHVKEFPIPVIPVDAQSPFIQVVDKILAITANDDYLQNALKQGKVKKYEEQIDQLVYKLYGLTLEDIKIVEA